MIYVTKVARKLVNLVNFDRWNWKESSSFKWTQTLKKFLIDQTISLLNFVILGGCNISQNHQDILDQ